MSECKKTCGNCAGRIESILSKDRCDMTRNTIENYSNTCNHWEPNRETKVVMQKDELKALRKERDELQAQVKERELDIERIEAKCCQCHVEHAAQMAVLRGALEEINKVSTEQGLSMLDGACKVDKLACDALETTPSEASERVQKLAELLQDAVSETENAERLSKGFCSAAKAALSEWRRDK